MVQYVPGLMPQQEEGQGGGRRSRKQGRTQVQEPESRVSLRPSASPGNYYSRPQQPQRNQKADQFISALGQVSDVSGKLGQYMYEKQQKEAELQAKQEIQSMSLEEAKEKVQSGELDQYDNPYFQDAFQRQYGIRLGLHKGREMRTKFETGFDPRNDNIDEFIQGHLDPEMQRMADNPIISEAFVQTVDGDVQKLRTEDYSRKAAAIEQDKLDGAYEMGVAGFERALSRASTPRERQQAVDQGYKEWRDGYAERRELFGLTNSEQDALTLQLASKFARDGNVDVVEKLLTDKRGGVGAIIDKRGEMGAEAASILNAAEQNLHNDNKEKSFDQWMSYADQADQGILDRDELIQYHKDNPGVYTRAQVNSLIRQSESAQEAKRRQLEEDRVGRQFETRQEADRAKVLTDTLKAVKNKTLHQLDQAAIPSGYDKETGEIEYEMLSPEDRIDMADEVIQNRVLPEYAQQFDEEERGYQAFLYELGLYGNNPDMENKKWKRTLSNVGSALTTEAAAGEVPPKIESAYALFKNLKTSAPGMLNSNIINERDRDVLESLWYHEQYLDQELDQAVNSVYRMQHSDDDNRFASTQFQEMEESINSLDGFLDGWGQPKNDAYVSAELNRLARNQWRAGGSSNVESVVERFKEEHEWINGHAVPLRGQNVPTDFPELAQARIRKYASEHQAEMEEKGVSADDLTVYPMGGRGSTGAWAIIQNESATPMNDMLGSQFTLGELKRDEDEALDQYRSDAIERANAPGPDRPQGAGERLRQSMRDDQETVSRGDAEDTRQIISGDDSVNDIDVSDAESVPGSEPRPEDLPATEPVEAKLPENEDPQVKEAVQKLKDAGLTKDQFDQFVKGHMGTDKAGNGLIFNPRLRERIRYYLPAS